MEIRHLFWKRLGSQYFRFRGCDHFRERFWECPEVLEMLFFQNFSCIAGGRMFQFLFRECSGGGGGSVGSQWEEEQEEGEEVDKPCCRGWFRCRPLSG